MNWLKIFRTLRPKTKPFSAWQIELTTRCPLRCKMCIREGIKDWHNADMSMDDFKKLIPYLKDVETVVLEGWGESLLHKNLIEIIRVAKAEGPRVGFVTSGKVLNGDYISELINADVDFIGFSLAGSSGGTHESIRVNSEFNALLENIKSFNEIKRNKKIKKPKLHIVYLMLKDNISEAPALLKLAKEIGIEEVILINLIHVTNEWQEEQRVFRCNENPPSSPFFKGGLNSPLSRGIRGVFPPLAKGGEGGFERVLEGDYESILKEAEAKAKELKITLRSHSLSPVDVGVCEENPLSNLYISVDGEVSPCVYLYPPVPSPFKRIFCSNEFWLEKVSFGNIFKEPFESIWNNKDYVKFREKFIQRKKRFEEIYSPFLDIERLKVGAYSNTPLPDPPKQCRTCHKMLGV